MKKIIIALAALLAVSSTNLFAQGNAKTDAKTETKMKKDGTPDKRFKENKEEKKHLKKDGTPDKRFNENNKK